MKFYLQKAYHSPSTISEFDKLSYIFLTRFGLLSFCPSLKTNHVLFGKTRKKKYFGLRNKLLYARTILFTIVNKQSLPINIYYFDNI